MDLFSCSLLYNAHLWYNANVSIMTRVEATIELEKRGWSKATDIWPGIWRRDKDGETRVWFQALQIEGIKFDRLDKPWNI